MRDVGAVEGSAKGSPGFGVARGDVEPAVPAGIGLHHPDRAAQFKPFAALRGYHDLVEQRERVKEPRPALTGGGARALGGCAAFVRGEVVRVAYYEAGSVVEQVGAVGQLDTVGRTLAVVKADTAWGHRGRRALRLMPGAPRLPGV